MRYDFYSPANEVKNYLSSFSASTPNPGAGGRLGALVFAKGSSGFARTFVNPWRKGFGPRLGFAYQFNKKTVLRASGGVYYAATSTGASTAGFNVNASFGSPDNFSPAYYWTDPFPTNYVKPPILDPSFLNGQTITWLNPDAGRNPQIVSWTFGIQRALTNDWRRSGLHRQQVDPSSRFPGRQSRAGSGVLSRHCPKPTGRAAVANANGIFEPFPGFIGQSTHTVAQALRPYPQYTAVNFGAATNPSGNSNFNSLQLKATKRFSHGLNFMAFYVWSKTMSSADTTPQNPLMNRFQAMSIGASDIPNSMQIAATYELPFGTGRHFLNGRSKWVNSVAGGWQLTTTLRYQSGMPLSLAGSNSLNGFGYAPKANYVVVIRLRLTAAFRPSQGHILERRRFLQPILLCVWQHGAYVIVASWPYAESRSDFGE